MPIRTDDDGDAIDKTGCLRGGWFRGRGWRLQRKGEKRGNADNERRLWRADQYRWVSRSLTPPVRSFSFSLASPPSSRSRPPLLSHLRFLWSNSQRRRILFYFLRMVVIRGYPAGRLFPSPASVIGDEIGRIRFEGEEKWSAIIVRRTKQIRSPNIPQREVSGASARKSVDLFDRYSVNAQVSEAGTTH